MLILHYHGFCVRNIFYTVSVPTLAEYLLFIYGDAILICIMSADKKTLISLIKSGDESFIPVYFCLEQKFWRKRWDSNPRYGVSRTPDFESGSL